MVIYLFFILMFSFVGFVTIYPLLGKKNKENEKPHKATLKSTLRKFKPSKLEKFMTFNFGLNSKSKWKNLFIITQISLFLIGFSSVILGDMFPTMNFHWYTLTISTYTFAILLTLLAIFYSVAKVLKTIRFRKIADSLGYSVKQINHWIEFHNITDEDILGK